MAAMPQVSMVSPSTALARKVSPGRPVVEEAWEKSARRKGKRLCAAEEKERDRAGKRRKIAKRTCACV
jgi:hypothetical protein